MLQGAHAKASRLYVSLIVRFRRFADEGRARLVAFGLWSVVAVVVQRWASIAEGIREQFAADVRSYEVIARAAPSLPSEGVLRPFAERFPVHWLVGTFADATGLSLENAYRVASVLTVALVLTVTHLTLARLRLPTAAYAIALGALAASAYPLHYLLAAPGMVSDAVFLLGLALVLYGFVRGRLMIVLAGLVVALLGRQTAVPVALAAAVWAAAAPAWRHARWRVAAACALVPGVLYLVLRVVADDFAIPHVGPVDEMTVIGYLKGPDLFVEHVGRILIGIVVPAALVLGAWLRTRAPLPRGALLLAAVIVAQPLVLGPSSTGDNEPRLAALAAPALALAAGALLRDIELRGVSTLALATAVAIAGLHHRYTWLGPGDRIVWGVILFTAAIAIVAVLGGPQLRAWAGAARSHPRSP
jgi:hypothetical protein